MKLRIAKKVLKACDKELRHRPATLDRALQRDAKTESSKAIRRMWKAIVAMGPFLTSDPWVQSRTA